MGCRYLDRLLAPNSYAEDAILRWRQVTTLVLLVILSSLSAGHALGFERSTVVANVDGVDINVYLYEPDGAGPFPLLVLSHGTPRNAEDRVNVRPGNLEPQAKAYAASGVAVAIPIRRGYGGYGQWAEGYGGCDHADFYHAGLAGAEDIEAAIAAVSKRPDIDASRIALMGVSAGGWASLAAATKGGVLGVVSFAGGRGSRGPDHVCGEDQLVHAAGMYGAGSHVPQLWIYSRNDHFFGPALAVRLHNAFVAAGGQADFVIVPPYGDEGHRYIANIASWKPTVDQFLRMIGFLH